MPAPPLASCLPMPKPELVCLCVDWKSCIYSKKYSIRATECTWKCIWLTLAGNTALSQQIWLTIFWSGTWTQYIDFLHVVLCVNIKSLKGPGLITRMMSVSGTGWRSELWYRDHIQNLIQMCPELKQWVCAFLVFMISGWNMTDLLNNRLISVYFILAPHSCQQPLQELAFLLTAACCVELQFQHGTQSTIFLLLTFYFNLSPALYSDIIPLTTLTSGWIAWMMLFNRIHTRAM